MGYFQRDSKAIEAFVMSAKDLLRRLRGQYPIVSKRWARYAALSPTGVRLRSEDYTSAE